MISEPILAHICPRCNCLETKEIILPKNSKQYSRIECANCHQFIKFGRSPLVTAEHESRIKVIDRYLKYGFCSLWQRNFLKNIRDKRWLTDKQRATYESITAIYKMN